MSEAELENLAARTVEALKNRQAVLATVESCTGGLLASQLTDSPGVSQVFWGGWCVYDNSAKLRLGVPEEALRQEGAVSALTARWLAEQGLDKMSQAIAAAPRRELGIVQPLSRLIAVSTTGIAGPSGGRPAKPVGLCHIGLATGDGRLELQEIRAAEPLERPAMKRLFCAAALRLVLEILTGTK